MCERTADIEFGFDMVTSDIRIEDVKCINCWRHIRHVLFCTDEKDKMNRKFNWHHHLSLLDTWDKPFPQRTLDAPLKMSLLKRLKNVYHFDIGIKIKCNGHSKTTASHWVISTTLYVYDYTQKHVNPLTTFPCC